MNKPRVNNFLEQISTSKLVHCLLLFALGWGIVQVLAYLSTVIVIFTLAAVLAFVLNYPVQWVERFLPHTLAVILVFLVSLLILAIFTLTIGFAALSQGQQLLSQSPEFVNFIISLLERLEALLDKWNLQVDLSAVEKELRNQALAGIGVGFATVQRLLTSLVDVILIAVVAFFMLLDGERLWYFILKFFPEGLRHELTVAIQRNFLGFFWGRLILSVFFGISAFIVFLILQVPYALILATIAGVFDLIPGIGATLGISLVALIVLPQGIWLSLKVLLGCILLQQIEENLLMPRIMQGSLNINPVVMFFALLIGARVAGLLGVFLAVPIAGVIISLFEMDELKAD
ncbi:AI-2E family transporter [Fischerella thermalis]|uniref:AI-2E family transporter n=1 Tax=Fischerella thermalis TaxID=372787 RepID=UPI0019FE1470|nr:AI-2E family transporter [Fischerella thermalis]MBF1990871.1 AI-2E family transporter [Fischerella thermalis M58_A2018_009]MBF2061639.1 AI-2E family transporter [Fischerella thermalis M66_A2018_004]MBF2071648.1 AI-2E family transporter [Fischerella thermalis M48_A2018_028]